MEKCITNQTDFDITVTLFVAELIDNTFRTKETHTIDINPNESKEVKYGNVLSSFISGIDVSANINGSTLTTSQKSCSVESPFSQQINQKYCIEIKGLRTLDIELVN